MLTPLPRRLALLLLALPIVGTLLPAAAATAWDPLTLAVLAPALIVAIVAASPGRDATRTARLAAAAVTVLAAITTAAIAGMHAYNAGLPQPFEYRAHPWAALEHPAQLWAALLGAALVGRSLGPWWAAVVVPLLVGAAVCGERAWLHEAYRVDQLADDSALLTGALVALWCLGMLLPRFIAARWRTVFLLVLAVVASCPDLHAWTRTRYRSLAALLAPDRVELLDVSQDGSTLLLSGWREGFPGATWVRRDGLSEPIHAGQVRRGNAGPNGAHWVKSFTLGLTETEGSLLRFADGRPNACPDVERVGITWRGDGRAAFFQTDGHVRLDDGACIPIDGADDVAFLGQLPAWSVGALVFVDSNEVGQLQGEIGMRSSFLAGDGGLVVIGETRASDPHAAPARRVVARVTTAGLVPLIDAEADRVHTWDGAVCVGDPAEWTCWSPDDDEPTIRTGDAFVDLFAGDARPTPAWGPLRADGHRRDLRTFGYYDLAPDGTLTAWRWGIPADEPVPLESAGPLLDPPEEYPSD